MGFLKLIHPSFFITGLDGGAFVMELFPTANANSYFDETVFEVERQWHAGQPFCGDGGMDGFNFTLVCQKLAFALFLVVVG